MALLAFEMWDDTLLIVCTDHGFLLGEHDWWAKSVMPWYNKIIQTPLFIWDPRSKLNNQRRKSLVQTIDFAPTILDFFQAEIPDTVQGKSLEETIEQDARVREGGLFGIHGGHVNVTDGRFVYMRAPRDVGNSPLYEYTIMPTHMNTMFDPAELQDLELAEPFSFMKNVRPLKAQARTRKPNRG